MVTRYYPSTVLADPHSPLDNIHYVIHCKILWLWPCNHHDHVKFKFSPVLVLNLKNNAHLWTQIFLSKHEVNFGAINFENLKISSIRGPKFWTTVFQMKSLPNSSCSWGLYDSESSGTKKMVKKPCQPSIGNIGNCYQREQPYHNVITMIIMIIDKLNCDSSSLTCLGKLILRPELIFVHLI